MKPLLVFALIFLLLTATASSQSKFGFFLGPQMTTAKYKINGYEQSTSSKFGFHAGVNWKIPFEEKIFFAPAIFYSMKGYKVEFDRPSVPPDADAIDNNTTIHTGEVAALLQFDFGKSASHFFFRAGPTLDFQLFGKERFNLDGGGETDRSMKFSFGDYGRYAANFLLQLGYEMEKGTQIFATYSHGMTNINNADDGPAIRHRVFGLSVGKSF